MEVFAQYMRQRFQEAFAENVSLAEHTLMRVGGPARYFLTVATLQDLKDALSSANTNAIPVHILGGGSNTLVSDIGFHGLVIKLANRSIEIHNTSITVGAGAISALVARKAAEAGLSGFSWAITLPGTIGGAVRGNAGCFGGEMSDVVESVEVIHGGNIQTYCAKDLRFSYRHSMCKDQDHAQDVIFQVTLALTKGNKEEEQEKLRVCMEKRKATQPLGVASAGCMFQNVNYTSDEEIETLRAKEHVPQEMLDKKRISAGWIIDKLGLCGYQVGGASVAKEHGNFLLNNNHATAQDIRTLIQHIQSEAREKFGIHLEPEVAILESYE